MSASRDHAAALYPLRHITGHANYFGPEVRLWKVVTLAATCLGKPRYQALNENCILTGVGCTLSVGREVQNEVPALRRTEGKS